MAKLVCISIRQIVVIKSKHPIRPIHTSHASIHTETLGRALFASISTTSDVILFGGVATWALLLEHCSAIHQSNGTRTSRDTLHTRYTSHTTHTSHTSHTSPSASWSIQRRQVGIRNRQVASQKSAVATNMLAPSGCTLNHTSWEEDDDHGAASSLTYHCSNSGLTAIPPLPSSLAFL